MVKIIALFIALVASTALAQPPVTLNNWGYRQWLGPAVTLEEAVQGITESDQRLWLGYLASKELDGRRPNTAGYRAAVDYLEQLCQAWGLQTMRQTVPGWDQNLFAWVEGTERSDQIVVAGAHLDHLGNGRLGADDNGSGSSALLGIAYAISRMDPPKRTIVLQWYTAEESGLIGSKYYVNNPTFPRNNPSIRSHVAMINLDMVGWLRHTGGTIQTTAPFAAHIADLQALYPFGPVVSLRGSNDNSDHSHFRRNGVPVVFIHTGLHNDYHTIRDTVDKINFDGLTKIARYATELTWRVANDELAVQSELVRDEQTGRMFWHYSIAP